MSDYPVLTSLADGDLFEVLDDSEPVDSLKNKAVSYGSLKSQLSTDLTLGNPSLTTVNSGFETGYSGTLTFYKSGRLVTVSLDITVSSPSTILAINIGVIPAGLVPIVSVNGRATSTNSSDEANFIMDTFGQLNIRRHGTLSTVVTNGNYDISFSYYSAS